MCISMRLTIIWKLRRIKSWKGDFRARNYLFRWYEYFKWIELKSIEFLCFFINQHNLLRGRHHLAMMLWVAGAAPTAPTAPKLGEWIARRASSQCELDSCGSKVCHADGKLSDTSYRHRVSVLCGCARALPNTGASWTSCHKSGTVAPSCGSACCSGGSNWIWFWIHGCTSKYHTWKPCESAFSKWTEKKCAKLKSVGGPWYYPFYY